MTEAPAVLILQPNELLFSGVRLKQVCLRVAVLCGRCSRMLAAILQALISRQNCLFLPEHCVLPNWGLLQAYCQTITISNPSRATVEATLRAGSSDRWTISPTKLFLKPQQSTDIDVRLRVLTFAQKQKAIQQGQRDIFHIKVGGNLSVVSC